jgi:hypothetical protein
VFKKGKLYNRPDSVFALADIKFQLTVHGTYFPKATVFLCAAANGAVLPPFVVFRGHLKRLNDAREAYPDAFFVCSYQGGSDPDIFHWWLRDFFLKRIPRGTSRVTALYMCRPVNDVTLQVSEVLNDCFRCIWLLNFGMFWEDYRSVQIRLSTIVHDALRMLMAKFSCGVLFVNRWCS